VTAEADAPEPPRAAVVGVPDAVRARLATVASDPMSWLATGFVVAVGAILRLAGLGFPGSKIFDEVYYATEADELLHYGVEWKPENNAGDYVVHPPLGKWCIALGEWLFGYDSFGWRMKTTASAAAAARATPPQTAERAMRRERRGQPPPSATSDWSSCASSCRQAPHTVTCVTSSLMRGSVSSPLANNSSSSGWG